MNNPLNERLRHHVTGAIERGEAVAITEQRAPVSLEVAARDAMRAIEPIRNGKRDGSTMGRLSAAEDDLLLALLHHDPIRDAIRHVERLRDAATGDRREFLHRLLGNMRKV